MNFQKKIAALGGNLKWEDKILLFLAFLNFIASIVLDIFLKTNPLGSFQAEIGDIRGVLNWWGMGLLVIAANYLLFDLYVVLSKEVVKRWRKKKESPLLKEEEKKKRKKALKHIFYFLRTALLFLIFDSTTLLIIHPLYHLKGIRERLVNIQLLEIDKALTGKYLLFWLSSSTNPWRKFLDIAAKPATYSFLLLGFVLTIVLLFLYLNKKKNLFGEYIIAYFLVTTMATPLWYIFPANSPFNSFIYGKGRSLPFIQEELKQYHPRKVIEENQKSMWESQKKEMPLTTMPSMHWAWSLISVYFLAKASKLTLFFSLPWLFLNLIGTIYLGCHYLIDGIIALFLAVIAILLTELIAFYFKPEANPQEKEERKVLIEFLLKPFKETKEMFLPSR